jgi:hypothetical protein
VATKYSEVQDEEAKGEWEEVIWLYTLKKRASHSGNGLMMKTQSEHALANNQQIASVLNSTSHSVQHEVSS